MATFSLTRCLDVDLPAEVLWPVIADLDSYAAHARSLAETRVIRGEAEGARRRCVDTSGADWEETVMLWEPGRRYVIEVDVATYPAKFRALFRTFSGTWTVEPTGQEACTVTMAFDAELKKVPGLATVIKAMARKSAKDLDVTLASYAEAARTSTAA